MNDNFFQALVESIPVGIVLLEQADGAIRYINPQAAALLGVNARQLVGQSFAFAVPEFADDWLESLSSADEASVDVLGPLDGQILALTAFEPAPDLFGIVIHDVSARCDLGDPRMPASTLLSGLGEGRRILLVEDHPVNRMLATRILESAGFEVIPAMDGVAALDVLETSRIDLVLMDCNMPRMDGLEATRRLRAMETARGTARVPVLALTAHSSPVEQSACIAAGMDDFMGKPYTAFDLLEMIESHLARVGARDEDEDSTTAGADQVVGSVVAEEECLATLDLSLIKELREALGEDLNEIVDQFLFQLGDQVRLLGTAIAAGDVQQVRENAHALKGSAGNLGVSGLAGIAAEIETMAREHDLARVDEAFDRTQRCAAQTVVLLADMGFSAREV